MAGGGGGVMNWEIGIDIYTLICIKWITNKNLLYKKIKQNSKIQKKKKEETTGIIHWLHNPIASLTVLTAFRLLWSPALWALQQPPLLQHASLHGAASPGRLTSAKGSFTVADKSKAHQELI